MTNPVKPRPAAGASQAIPVNTANAALERLDTIRARQLSLKDEMIHNWQGWLGSLALHGALVMLFAAMGSAMVQEKKEYWHEVDMVQAKQNELTKDSLDDLFDDSPVDSDIDAPPSVDADVMRPTPGYNELTPGAPDWISSGGHLTGVGEGGGGGDHLAGKAWGGYIRGLQRTGLEVVFCFDSTGSMGGIILECKTRIRQLIKVVTYLVPNARVGIVTYRDWKKYDLDDYEYLGKYIPLQKCNKEGLDKLQRFLRECEAYGGGDIPEAVQVGLETSIEKSGWTPGTKKIIIVFGDAPPHPEDNGLSLTYNLCKKWKDAGGVLSCIDTTGGSKLLDEFKQMAAEGGGEATFLNDERAIIKQLVVLIFGSKWEKEIDNVYNTVMKGAEDTVVGP